jgi:serine/threonine-protein kinase RsbT
MTTCPVDTDSDVLRVQRTARTAALTLGFRKAEADELAIAASELATNILKYATRGLISFWVVDDPDRGIGMCIAARDQGPAFRDFSLALRDGFDDKGPIPPEALLARRGLGTGLGAVKRFTHHVEHEALDGQGKEIRALRFLKRMKK